MNMVQIACAFLFFQDERVPVSTTWFGTTSQAAKTGILPKNWAYSDLSASSSSLFFMVYWIESDFEYL